MTILPAVEFPYDPPEHADPAGYRLGIALGLNPFEVQNDSVTIAPGPGGVFILRWVGVKVLTSEEAQAAFKAAQALNHTDGSTR